MTWTQESIITLAVVPAVLLLATFGAVFLWRAGQADNVDGGMLKVMAAFLGLCVVVGAVALWWGMYPWRAEYHQWRPVSGTVASIDSRLMSSGEGNIEQKFVVTFTDSPERYGVLDTRAAAIRPGDRLSIFCVRRWQQAGSDGYDCLFDRTQR